MPKMEEPDQDGTITSRSKRVSQWQSSIPLEQETNRFHFGIISQLYNATLDLYKALIQSLRSEQVLPKPLYRQIESGYVRYVIWAHDHGADNGELDTLLDTSQRLRKFTVKILISICVILRETYSAHRLTKFDDKIRSLYQVALKATDEGSRIVHNISSYSDIESDTSDDEDLPITRGSLEDAVETLLAEIENLVDLGPRLEEPVPDVPMREQPAAAIPSRSWDPVQYFTNRVLAKFPKCDSNLAVALGNANWDSVRRLQTRREAASNPEHNAKNEVHKQVPADKAAASQDSGLGTSLSTTSSYAPTIFSYHGDGGTRTKIPPLPSNIKKGQLFPCIACGEQIVKRDMRIWKRHLLADLQPWICCQTSCPCGRAPFATREEWTDHLRKEHALHPDWDDKTCSICSEVVGGGLATISHIADHLEEISLAALPGVLEDGGDKAFTTTSNKRLKSKASDATESDPASPTEIKDQILEGIPLLHFSDSTTNPNGDDDDRSGSEQLDADMAGNVNNKSVKLRWSIGLNLDSGSHHMRCSNCEIEKGKGGSEEVWYCCNCNYGPMIVAINPRCAGC
ncbi:hypothetical protein F4677DRAFT_393928 [Hypoxylon crocopeplum]|nr:hypothetical protein F4677DRAFT_393928 [Hypoxylon crocopeplum]